MLWLLENWKLFAGVVLATGLYVSGYMHGEGDVQRKWDEEKLKATSIALKLEQDNARMINHLERVKNENEKRIDDLHGELAGLRVLLPKPKKVPRTGHSNPAATCGGDDGASGSWELSITAQEGFDNFEAGLVDRALEMDKVVENCRVLQGWALKQQRE